MAQRSIESYFNIRKRPAQDELISSKLKRSNKQIFENEDVIETKKSGVGDKKAEKSVTTNVETKVTTKRILRSRGASTVDCNNPPASNLKLKPVVTENNEVELEKGISKLDGKNVIDSKEISLDAIKKKVTRASRLASLKASIASFQESDKLLQASKTKQIKKLLLPDSTNAVDELKPVVKEPQDTNALEESVTSTKTDLKTPSTSTIKIPASKESLSLPQKYRFLAKLFEAIDSVAQILYNRQEIIIFTKLKSGVEQMLKRNLTEKHLAQIKFLYPDAYSFYYLKLRTYGTGTRRENWELVIKPNIEETNMTSNVLITRRQVLYSIMLEKTKNYHKDFLKTLNSSLKIAHTNIVRWHPQFNIENVPDVEVSPLPECPQEERLTTGSQVLEKARQMFKCNSRMEEALERLKKAEGTSQAPKEEVVTENPLLKNIPKALLEMVRQKQAAKALYSVTCSTAREKEAKLYSQLPDIARLTHSLYITEKKAVLPINIVIDKLCNSCRVFTHRNEMETYLRTMSREVPEWLVFHDIRGSVFIKISRNTDMTVIINKLTSLAESKKL